MPIPAASFVDLVPLVKVDVVKPKLEIRTRMGAQFVHVTLRYKGDRYAASFYKTIVADKEVIKTGETFVNCVMFNENGQRVRIPAVPFAALARKAAAILTEKPGSPPT